MGFANTLTVAQIQAAINVPTAAQNAAATNALVAPEVSAVPANTVAALPSTSSIYGDGIDGTMTLAAAFHAIRDYEFTVLNGNGWDFYTHGNRVRATVSITIPGGAYMLNRGQEQPTAGSMNGGGAGGTAVISPGPRGGNGGGLLSICSPIVNIDVMDVRGENAGLANLGPVGNGTSGFPTSAGIGGNGGGGGSAGAYTGGVGGVAYQGPPIISNPLSNLGSAILAGGGGGGGGAVNGAASCGGGGGGGGGAIIIICRTYTPHTVFVAGGIGSLGNGAADGANGGRGRFLLGIVP